jgi:hypothetical protein
MEPSIQPNQDGSQNPDSKSGVVREQSVNKLSKEQIINEHDLTFDPGDTLNGSLYICVPKDVQSPVDLSVLLSQMREGHIWSQDAEKSVPDEHRQAYKDQLDLNEVVEYVTDEGKLVIARFDHPKYPSDEGRWSDWRQFFDNRFEKV